jgi:hypothetical protein
MSILNQRSEVRGLKTEGCGWKLEVRGRRLEAKNRGNVRFLYAIWQNVKVINNCNKTKKD